eukprot:583327-Hanusia_phi.AAC.1
MHNCHDKARRGRCCTSDGMIWQGVCRKAGRKGTSPGTRKQGTGDSSVLPSPFGQVISLPVAGPGPLCAPARPEA